MSAINLESKGAIKKQRIRHFQDKWLEDVFKGLLATHQVQNKAFCSKCNTTIRCSKSHLIRHSQNVKHIQNMSSQNQSLEVKKKLSHKDKVKRAEIKLSAFFAEHNVALCITDHLVPLLKDICLEPEVVQDFSLGRLKCINIIQNVIAKREVEKIIDNLQTRKFSILIDESRYHGY